MKRITIAVFSTHFLLLSLVAPAGAGIPDLSLSWATTAYSGPGAAVLYNIPDGSGAPFTAARNLTGIVDATVTLHLLDGLGATIANFPYEDMWLESADGGMAYCTGGTIADQNTDFDGVTYWITPMAAGGSSTAPTRVFIAGAALTSGDLPISYNSADISADGIVNLTDVSLFAADFYGGYNFRSDFRYDNVVNLSDVVYLASASGKTCP